MPARGGSQLRFHKLGLSIIWTLSVFVIPMKKIQINIFFLKMTLSVVDFYFIYLLSGGGGGNCWGYIQINQSCIVEEIDSIILWYLADRQSEFFMTVLFSEFLMLLTMSRSNKTIQILESLITELKHFERQKILRDHNFYFRFLPSNLLFVIMNHLEKFQLPLIVYLGKTYRYFRCL